MHDITTIIQYASFIKKRFNCAEIHFFFKLKGASTLH